MSVNGDGGRDGDSKAGSADVHDGNKGKVVRAKMNNSGHAHALSARCAHLDPLITPRARRGSRMILSISTRRADGCSSGSLCAHQIVNVII